MNPNNKLIFHSQLILPPPLSLDFPVALKSVLELGLVDQAGLELP